MFFFVVFPLFNSILNLLLSKKDYFRTNLALLFFKILNLADRLFLEIKAFPLFKKDEKRQPRS